MTFPDWRQGVATMVLRESKADGRVSGPGQREPPHPPRRRTAARTPRFPTPASPPPRRRQPAAGAGPLWSRRTVRVLAEFPAVGVEGVPGVGHAGDRGRTLCGIRGRPARPVLPRPLLLMRAWGPAR
ncbi:hypothetical protein [Kitasatospora sp. NPDC058478]|uniref:hypothetical protein n=1 Tax=unclassified Kitasatospora TaxID=2633591 RepID=UPI003653A7DB